MESLTLAQSLIAQAEQQQGVSWQQLLWLAGAFAVIIVPFFVGGFFAKALKLPSHSVRIGFVLLAVTASIAVLVNRLPGLGVDLRGGTILVYEIDPSKSNPEADGASKVKSQDLVGPLTKRINPAGTREIVIRPYGDSQIEIIIPEVDQREVATIEEVLQQAGILRFAIVANRIDHQRLIDMATEQASSNDRAVRLSEVILNENNEVVGRWAEVDRETSAKTDVKPLRVDVGNAIVRNPQTGELIDLPSSVRGMDGEFKQAQWIDENGLNGLEVLMVIDPAIDVKGEDLAFASTTFDDKGAPAVAFNLTESGSRKFRVLTTENSPKGTRQRQLGIVMDDRLLSAPNILQPISKSGRITGNFTTEEVRSLVDILKAGQLPAALTKQPIAKNQIDATLGADTIRKGVYAIGTSLILVLLFILYYYRFAGLIACIALIMNLAMILATMVLINQPLTLPGLAGLVLTVGMSVDANVLIFERIREEINKGAKNRMAIRNGFAKATVTIVDANLTTLFTAIVLYAIGTDQIRGFAVTLILGILYSMFTAIYMSRTFFDIAERHNKLTLSMSDSVNSIRNALAGGGMFDFIGKGKIALVVSSILIVIGVASLVVRGKGILDIDFAGGSSVQFRVAETTSTEEIRRIVGDGIGEQNGSAVQFTVNGVKMDEAEPGTVFKVDSSIESVDELQSRIVESFASSPEAKLVTYNVTVVDESNSTSALPSDDNGVMLTAAQADESDAETTGEEAAQGDVASQTAVRRITLGVDGSESAAAISEPALIQRLKQASEELSIPLNDRAVVLLPDGEGSEDWKTGSSVPFSNWKITLPMDDQKATQLMAAVEQSLGDEPIWVSSSSVGARVAGQMIGRASVAMFASLMVIILYIWFRFQRVIYGFAAVAALIHDVLITLGAIAISFYVADALKFLYVDQFKISLTVVAALLTIIGYSLNDTIVVFDRIRETKGKAPRLTGEMINTSINQTLSRTLLTSITTLIVVVLLYVFGGEGIHAFAFALVVGVLVGTYSSVFVASPILLWLVQRGEAKTQSN
ncbi:protein translocase subunit SecD [Rhodopirellula sp. MGV]|uniref:protein translocase subunit SecD n=1 Tax=Rhodopirellula sp. MGV TaxID=2023130 RepID=UPI000B9794EE|nr:protein translocase subunit SecD [Rhodopirellula sp. MGV]OYP34688.1 protein translocase subunit SecDF [Rhodopirellula sp. MGV]PNY34358.1 protein translocase subunit SecD [Rhodopirellula baltica]